MSLPPGLASGALSGRAVSTATPNGHTPVLTIAPEANSDALVGFALRPGLSRGRDFDYAAIF